MSKVPSETAGAMLALRDLIVAICHARPDGPELLATLTSGRTRIVIDERETLITIGISAGRGEPVQWMETIRADPSDETTFGTLESARVFETRGVTH